MKDETKTTFTTGEFAKEFGIKKDTLFYYDKVGLFKPAGVHPNGYRYYTIAQFDTFSAIQSLRIANVSIEALQNYFTNPSLPSLHHLTGQQLQSLEAEIKQLLDTKYYLEQVSSIIEEISKASLHTVTYKMLAATPIKTSDVHLPHDHSLDDLSKAYDLFMKQLSIKTCASVGTVFPIRAVFQEAETPTCPLFTRVQHSDEVIPAGLYMVYYDQGNFSEVEQLYQKILTAIEQDGYEIDGPFYEEYLLHALMPGSEDQYLTKFFVKVKEKQRI